MESDTKQRLRTRVSLAALVAAGILAACSDSSDSSDAAQAGAETAEAASTTFVFGLANEPRTLDPAYVYDGDTLRILDQIYETLVMLEPGTAQIVPGLAESYTVSPDGLTYTFALREGVRFHDGTDFDAAAVCYNFDRLYNFKGVQQSYSLSTFWQIIFGGFATQDSESSPKTSLYASCEARDARTAVLKLTSPSSALVAALASRYMGIVSPAAVEKYGDDAEISGGSFSFPGTFGSEHPTGTGPFKFETWQRGDKLSLVRNDDYWGDKASIHRLVFKAIPDGPARRQALESGEIDGYDAVAPQDIDALREAGYTILQRAPYNVGYLGFQQRFAPLDNLKVRQAIAHSLNRQALVNAYFPPDTRVADQFLTREILGYSDNVPKYDYDPEKAKQLLAESGVSDLTVEFWYPTGVSRSYMPDPKAIMETFKADMEKVGFTVVPKAVPWTPDYVAGIQRGDAPMYIVGRLGTYADPSDFLGSLFSNSQRMATSPAVVEGLEKALAEVDVEKRAAMYRDLNDQIMAVVPGVPYASVPAFLAFKPGVKGFVTSPVAQESMATVTVD